MSPSPLNAASHGRSPMACSLSGFNCGRSLSLLPLPPCASQSAVKDLSSICPDLSHYPALSFFPAFRRNKFIRFLASNNVQIVRFFFVREDVTSPSFDVFEFLSIAISCNRLFSLGSLDFSLLSSSLKTVEMYTRVGERGSSLSPPC